jgi:hypothetical protein
VANTDNETRIASNAFKEIATKYKQYLDFRSLLVKNLSIAILSNDKSNIEQYIQFLDQREFEENYDRLTRARKAGQACANNSFTTKRRPVITGRTLDLVGGGRAIWISRSAPSLYPTVVHEMLHFLSHDNFSDAVGKHLDEAVTEHFTRKIVKKPPRSYYEENMYGQRYAMLTHARIDTKIRGENLPKGYMRRAYFQGEWTAIDFIRSRFGEINTLFDEDERSLES